MIAAQTDRPWMAAVETQFAALSASRQMLDWNRARENSDEHFGRVDAHACQLLPNSVPYFWSKETAAAVWLASRSVPTDARLSADLLPDDAWACWWWFDWPLPVPLKDRTPIDGLDSDHIAGLLLSKQENRLLVLDYRTADFGPALSGFFTVPLDTDLGSLVSAKSFDASTNSVTDPSMRALALSKFIAAAGVWLKQRITTVGSGHIERHRRKQLAREHDAHLSDVKVIQLRRLVSETHAADADPVEWSCRWIVSGHWRNQPYANGAHKLIYILPYVKGPEDKPLKVPTQTVYAVNR